MAWLESQAHERLNIPPPPLAAVELSLDHKPNRKDERQRIEDVGGTIVWAGTWRVGGILAVSRSFGNRQLKQFIVAHPDIRVDELHPGGWGGWVGGGAWE